MTYNGTTFPAGMAFYFPVYELHHDERFWPDPERFDPMRFAPENKRNIKPMAYAPFGEGPRNCIGVFLTLRIWSGAEDRYLCTKRLCSELDSSLACLNFFSCRDEARAAAAEARRGATRGTIPLHRR